MSLGIARRRLGAQVVGPTGSQDVVWAPDIEYERSGPSESVTGCAGDPLEVGWVAARQDPCWRDKAMIDAFDRDGKYSGDVAVPEELLPYEGPLAIRGRMVVGVVRDDAGTYVVKRYRLVLPGEE